MYIHYKIHKDLKENGTGRLGVGLGTALAIDSSNITGFLASLAETALKDVATPTYLDPAIKGLKF